MSIKLILTEEQAKIASRACEFYARILYGQFWEITYETIDKESSFPEDFCFRAEQAERHFLEARKYLMPELKGRGHSYGLGHSKTADMSYDIYQVLRILFGDDRKPFSYYDLPTAEMIADEK